MRFLMTLKVSPVGFAANNLDQYHVIIIMPIADNIYNYESLLRSFTDKIFSLTLYDLKLTPNRIRIENALCDVLIFFDVLKI